MTNKNNRSANIEIINSEQIARKGISKNKKNVEAHNLPEDHVSRKLNLRSKERITVQISKDVIERVKDCVYWNRLTVAQFVEEALAAALQKAEKQNGKPFSKRRTELKPGRPIK